MKQNCEATATFFSLYLVCEDFWKFKEQSGQEINTTFLLEEGFFF